MMIHAAIRWPDTADPQLWPMAVDYAVHICNHLPKLNGIAPIHVASRSKVPRVHLQDLHVWGCPVYVLDKTIADGKSLPRWRPQSGRHVFVGTSAQHAHKAPLVLSLDSGKITAQYNAVFDDWFHTVHTSDATQVNFDHDHWYKMFGLTPWQYIPDDSDHPTSDQTSYSQEREALR